MAVALNSYIKSASSSLSSGIANSKWDGYSTWVDDSTCWRRLDNRIEWCTTSAADRGKRSVVSECSLAGAVRNKHRNAGGASDDQGWQILVHLAIAVVVFTIAQLRSARIYGRIVVVAIVWQKRSVAIGIRTAASRWPNFINGEGTRYRVETSIRSGKRNSYRARVDDSRTRCWRLSNCRICSTIIADCSRQVGRQCSLARGIERQRLRRRAGNRRRRVVYLVHGERASPCVATGVGGR